MRLIDGRRTLDAMKAAGFSPKLWCESRKVSRPYFYQVLRNERQTAPSRDQILAKLESEGLLVWRDLSAA